MIFQRLRVFVSSKMQELARISHQEKMQRLNNI